MSRLGGADNGMSDGKIYVLYIASNTQLQESY